MPTRAQVRITASSRLRRNWWRSRSPSLEQHDRVGHELAGAVIGDVAAALDLDDRDVAGREHVLLRLAPAAEREHVRVLDDDQRVGRFADLARLDERELLRPHLAVVGGAEIEDLPGRGHRCAV